MSKISAYIVTTCLFFILPLFSFGVVQVRISPSFTDSLLCRGGDFDLPFIVDSELYYQEGNIFRVYLSDAYGSFATSLKVGEIGALDDGTVHCTIPATINTGTAYRLRITSSTPAETSADNGRNIRISDFPTVTASNNGPLCPTGVLHLTGVTNNTSNNTFSWTGPNGYTSSAQNPVYNQPSLAAKGVYTLAVTHYGCTTRDTTNVVIVDPPEPWIRPAGPVSVCIGASVTLDAQDTSFTPGLNITWKGPGNFNVNYSVFQRYNADTSAGGMYVVTLQVGTCIKKDSALVVMLPRPDSASTTISNSPVCMGDTIKLNATSPSPNIKYVWTGPNNFSAIGQSPIIPNVTAANAGDYIVQSKFLNNGCLSLETKTKVLIGSPLVAPTIKGNVPLCGGGDLKLTAYGVSTNMGLFTWTGPNQYKAYSKSLSIGNINKASNAGTYYVVQNYNGCASPPAHVDVVITEVPEPKATNSGPICDGSDLIISAIDIVSATYEWTGPHNFATTGRTFTRSKADTFTQGLYRVTAHIANCSNTSTTEAEVNLIPKVKDILTNSPACLGDTISFKALTDLDSCSFAWKGPNGFNTNIKEPSIIAHNNDIAGIYSVIAMSKNCFSEEAFTDIKVKPLPEAPVVTTNSPIQEGSELKLTATCATPGVSFEWTGVNGFKAVGDYVTIKDILSADAGIYYVNAVWDGCKTPGSGIVTVLSADHSVLGLYPNPGDGLFNFTGFVKTKEAFNLQIYNAIGQPVYREKIIPVNSKFSTTIDLRSMPAGVYTMYVRIGKEEQRIKLVIK